MSSTKVIPIVDPGAVEYNRRIVLAATITVLVFSNTSFILRLIARRMQHQRLQADDYFMGLALPFSKLTGQCSYCNAISYTSLEDNISLEQLTFKPNRVFDGNSANSSNL
jgi:hypothetical protein